MFAAKKIDRTVLARYVSQGGQTLASLPETGPVLLVFLRHFGCAFCREAAADLAKNRQGIEAKGATLALVHLGTEEKAAWFFAPYHLSDVPRFSDPEAHLYQAFGLTRVELRQLITLKNAKRILIAWAHGHMAILPKGAIQRMPGVFLLQNGEIRKSFRHKQISDRPNYVFLATAEQ